MHLSEWKGVLKGPDDNKSALVEVMAWHRTGDKPLSYPKANPVLRRIQAALRGDELILEVPRDFVASRQPFWMTSSGSINALIIIDSPGWNYKGTMYNVTVNTVTADGLAPLDGKISAGIMVAVTNFGSPILYAGLPMQIHNSLCSYSVALQEIM